MKKASCALFELQVPFGGVYRQWDNAIWQQCNENCKCFLFEQ